MRALAITVLMASGCRFHFDPQDDAAALASIAFVQQDASFKDVFATSVASIGFANDVAAHDAIIVAAFVRSPTVAIVAVTDTLGNTYTPVIGFGSADSAGRHYYVLLATDTIAGPDTLSVALSGVPNNELEVFIVEYSGLVTSSAFDTGAIGFGTTASGVADEMQSGFRTTTTDHELIFGYGVGTGSVVPGTGFSSRNTIHGDLIEERIVSTSASYQTTAASDPGGSWAMIMAAFSGAR